MARRRTAIPNRAPSRFWSGNKHSSPGRQGPGELASGRATRSYLLLDLCSDRCLRFLVQVAWPQMLTA